MLVGGGQLTYCTSNSLAKRWDIGIIGEIERQYIYIYSIYIYIYTYLVILLKIFHTLEKWVNWSEITYIIYYLYSNSKLN